MSLGHQDVRSDAEVIQTIKDIYEAEQLNPTVAMDATDLPESYESITREWLTAVLAKDTPGAECTGFTLGPKDDGTANRRRIHSISWNEEGTRAGLPASVFCKATHDLVNRLNMWSFGGTDAEVSFFSTIRNMIDIEAPRAWWSTYDPLSFNSISVLHDMTDKVEFLNFETPASRDMVEQQLKLLAQLHGRFWMSKEPEIARRGTFRESFHLFVLTAFAKEACEAGFEAGEPEIPKAMYARKSEIWPATVLSYERNATLPYTLAHGDLHLGNWYRTPEGKLGVTDFQNNSRGTYARDIAYILGTSPSIENRRKWDKELVRYYLVELHKAGGPVIGFEEAWLEMRLQSFTVLAYWTLTLRPFAGSMPAMQTERTSRGNIKRIATFMDDIDALGAAHHFSSSKN